MSYSLRAGSGRNEFRPDPARKLSAKLYDIPFLRVQWKTPEDGQRNCPKHVEFYSKNKYEKLVYLVGFIIRIFHDARSPERQERYNIFSNVRILITIKEQATCRYIIRTGRYCVFHVSIWFLNEIIFSHLNKATVSEYDEYVETICG